MKRWSYIPIMVVVVLLVLSGCAGRDFIMPEKQINQTPAVPVSDSDTFAYDVIWVDFHPILLISEGIGANHVLHFDESGEKFLATKVRTEDKDWRMMVIIPENSGIKLSEAKAIIPSRSGKRFYSLNGEEAFSKTGYLLPKFSWDDIGSVNRSGAEIWENVSSSSSEHAQIQQIITGVAKKLDEKNIPGVFDRALKKVAKITTQDIMLAGATDFSSLFAIVGVRAWAIVEAVVQKADLSLPFYDTAPVNRFQMAQALQPLQKQLDNLTEDQKAALKEWLKAMEKYRQDRKAWRERCLE